MDARILRPLALSALALMGCACSPEPATAPPSRGAPIAGKAGEVPAPKDSPAVSGEAGRGVEPASPPRAPLIAVGGPEAGNPLPTAPEPVPKPTAPPLPESTPSPVDVVPAGLEDLNLDDPMGSGYPAEDGLPRGKFSQAPTCSCGRLGRGPHLRSRSLDDPSAGEPATVRIELPMQPVPRVPPPQPAPVAGGPGGGAPETPPVAGGKDAEAGRRADLPASSPTPPPEKKAEHAKARDLTFDDLASFDCPREDTPAPGRVTAWDGMQVNVAGFMLPLDSDDDGMVHAFVLAPYIPGCCCFGAPFRRNDLVRVDLVEKAGCTYAGGRVSVSGKLSVNRVPDREGFYYRLAGEIRGKE